MLCMTKTSWLLLTVPSPSNVKSFQISLGLSPLALIFACTIPAACSGRDVGQQLWPLVGQYWVVWYWVEWYWRLLAVNSWQVPDNGSAGSRTALGQH